jgi:hypothetical protein
MIGSAPYTSLSNVKLNVDGADIATGSVDSNGYISFTLPTAFNLTTGSHIVKVFADVVGGASRNFYVSLEQVSDFLVEDSQVSGAFVTLGGNAASNMVGGTVTIGTISSTFTSEDINQFNATLAVSGTNVLVQVTGAVNDNVTWTSITTTTK